MSTDDGQTYDATELVKFIRARLDEDAERKRDGEQMTYEHERYRRIVERPSDDAGSDAAVSGDLLKVFQLIGRTWEAHSDYRPEWRFYASSQR
ncbi:hypothetical protein ACWFOS_18910 [Gordonia terrae]